MRARCSPRADGGGGRQEVTALLDNAVDCERLDFDRQIRDFLGLQKIARAMSNCRAAAGDYPYERRSQEASVQYLCLVYFEPDIFDRMSDEERRAFDRDLLDL